MIGLVGAFFGEVIFETAKFLVMILLLVAAVCIGGKLRKNSDKKKAEKAEESMSEHVNS
ncbi:MAG: hypothetical protein PHW47_03855 [Lachnospira sp.]|nr:hypothetical protein [Lachnospira sp.]